MESKYDNILIPVDFGRRTDIQIQQAYYLARLMNSSMTLLHVINQRNSISYQDQQSSVSYVGADEDIIVKIRRLATHFSQKFSHEVDYAVLEGNVYEQIVDFAAKTHARLIVMGKSGKTSPLQNSIGKYTAQVVRMANCPVLTINSIVKTSFDKILLPLDLSKQIRNKIAVAVLFSRYYGSTIKLLTVITRDNFSKEKEFTEKMNKTREFLTENNVACTTEIIYNFSANTSIADRIIQYASDTESDIVMIMTQQEQDWRHTFVGSTASNIIKNSQIPVISITPNDDAVRNI
ncbi:MAG: universal stress protein [Bacteroidales bacterium]|jgi:nucleotide-binding universal stress UspA family protein|nr:universal stress protein [Bacteroidales bacterium]